MIQRRSHVFYEIRLEPLPEQAQGEDGRRRPRKGRIGRVLFCCMAAPETVHTLCVHVRTEALRHSAAAVLSDRVGGGVARQDTGFAGEQSGGSWTAALLQVLQMLRERSPSPPFHLSKLTLLLKPLYVK